MRYFFASFLILVFIGCGYKPVSHYAKKSLGTKIYAEIQTSPSEPENTVKIRDQVRLALLSKFGSRLTDDKKSAQTLLDIAIAEMTSNVLQINAQGYAIVYRMNVKLRTIVVNVENNKTTIITSAGSQDFPVDPSVGISSSAQSEAIGSAANKAVDSLISQLALSGLNKK